MKWKRKMKRIDYLNEAWSSNIDDVHNDAKFRINTMKRLIVDEGIRKQSYRDKFDHMTIGIGHLMSQDECDDPHCWEMSPNQIIHMFRHDYALAHKAMMRFIDPLTPVHLAPDRCGVILCMAFQLGLSGLFRFVKFRQAVWNGDFGLAAEEMCNSLWYEQTTNRARRLTYAMRDGIINFDDVDDTPDFWDIEI